MVRTGSAVQIRSSAQEINFLVNTCHYVARQYGENGVFCLPPRELFHSQEQKDTQKSALDEKILQDRQKTP